MESTVNVEKPNVSFRKFSHDEQSSLLNILTDAFGSFADIPRTTAAFASHRVNSDNCFIAEENQRSIGWIVATSLPREKWFVIRHLSVRDALSRRKVAEELLERAIEYVESKTPEFMRATTPAVQPYVEVYRKHGFEPLRRDFRISWQTEDVPYADDPTIETKEVSDDTRNDASGLFVRSLSPIWDWRTEEEGGRVAVAESFKAETRGARWILANLDKGPVGLVGIIPDYYGTGVGWFRGAYVAPEYRGRGIGSTLMSEIARLAKKLGQRKMIVYTFSYLDSLAPGALLYLKSGGKIEAEYLQLSRPIA
jgi:GNAT superfamily N-acetyltransferase